MKQDTSITVTADDGETMGIESEFAVSHVGSKMDKKDMWRMGKKQQLRRNFHFMSIFGFTMVLMATWEASLSANIFGLINGGTGGLIWMYIGCFIGVSICIVCMAEMASM